MLNIYTTEEKLVEITLEGSDWLNIINKLHKVTICNDSAEEEWDITNEVLLSLHRAQTILDVDNELIKDINNDPSHVRELSNPIYILDMNEKEAQAIAEKYGVIFLPSVHTPEPVVAKNGWDIDTSDSEIPNNWEYFLNGIETPFHALAIVDRYFFSSQVGETFADAISNLRGILNTLLPDKGKPVHNMTVSIIFDETKADAGYDMAKIATEVNKVKKSLVNKAPFNMELFAVNSNCYRYEDTHDRFIISNYFVISASHKLKAYRPTDDDGDSLCNQILTFNYLYSKGLAEGDRSSAPVKTQDRVISALCEALHTSKKEITYAVNGQTKRKGDIQLNNELFCTSADRLHR